jgi:hypothetical protein
MKMVLSAAHVRSILVARTRVMSACHGCSHAIRHGLSHCWSVPVAWHAKSAVAKHGKWRISVHRPSSHWYRPVEPWRSGKPWGWSHCRGESRRSTTGAHSLHSGMRAHCRLKTTAGLLARPHSKRVLGKAQSNSTLHAVMEWVTIKLVQGLGSKRGIFELNEAHGSILLRSEAQALVPALL